MTASRPVDPAIVARAVNSRLRVGRLTQAGQGGGDAGVGQHRIGAGDAAARVLEAADRLLATRLGTAAAVGSALEEIGVEGASSIGFTSARRTGDDMEAINRLFTPEFRNRLDAIIPFAPLPTPVIHEVVQKFVMQLEAQLSDRGVTFELEPEAIVWLAEKGYDENMGARPLGRVIQKYIKTPLADEVLFGKLKRGGTVKVSVADGADGRELKLEAIADDAPARRKATESRNRRQARVEEEQDDYDGGDVAVASPPKAASRPAAKQSEARRSGTVPKVPRNK